MRVFAELSPELQARVEAIRAARSPWQIQDLSVALRAPVTELSPREADVLLLIARGCQDEEISAELGIARSTVKRHLAHLFEKLAAGNRASAVARAYETSVLEPGWPPEGLGTLSAREIEVLELVAAGFTDPEIAAELIIGHATVKTHLTHILARLPARNRAHAVAIGYDSGILTVTPL